MKARRVYEALRRQLHQRGLLRPRYLTLGESAVLARVRRELSPRKITQEELDEYFDAEKRKR
jgi:hypothetical protein